MGFWAERFCSNRKQLTLAAAELHAWPRGLNRGKNSPL
jgi:hypothetical protein